MPHIAPPILPPPTVLERIGDYFKNIADDFYALYDRLKDVWLLGSHLRWPFYWLWFYFDFISTKFYQADDLVRSIKRWVDGLVEGTVFEGILDWLSYQYRTIRIDPTGWVRSQFAKISHEAWQILYVPTTWVFDRIRAWIPWWDDFRHNPTEFILNRITMKYPWLGQFLSNAIDFVVDKVYAGIGFIRELRDRPQSTIVNWLSVWYAWIRDFLSNPMWFIIQKIKDYSVEVRLMIDDPYAWVRSKIKNIMGWSDIDISDIAFYMFRRFLQRANDYVEREYMSVREVAINIIMRFM